jgi:lysophospholipase L1-like esterase
MQRLFFPSIALNLVFILGLFLMFNFYPVYQKGLIFKKIHAHQERRTMQFDALPTEEGSYIFWGDTRIESANWDELLENPKVRNRGNAGETLPDFLKILPTIAKAKPAKLFLLMGYQDLLVGKKPDEVYQAYIDLMNEIKKQLPKTRIYLHAIPPTALDLHKPMTNADQIQILNGKLKDLAQKYELYYIDLWSGFVGENNAINPKYTNDGFHLNGAGYIRWKTLVEQYVKEAKE